jgi:hypothetical protein
MLAIGRGSRAGMELLGLAASECCTHIWEIHIDLNREDLAEWTETRFDSAEMSHPSISIQTFLVHDIPMVLSGQTRAIISLSHLPAI